MRGEAKIFGPYQSNLETLADDISFDLYRCSGFHLSESNVLLTSTVLFSALRPKWIEAVGNRS
jgi:hypothetical protein